MPSAADILRLHTLSICTTPFHFKPDLRGTRHPAPLIRLGGSRNTSHVQPQELRNSEDVDGVAATVASISTAEYTHRFLFKDLR
jgi:hypothetical protein